MPLGRYGQGLIYNLLETFNAAAPFLDKDHPARVCQFAAVFGGIAVHNHGQGRNPVEQTF
jgi:hypothetical protein